MPVSIAFHLNVFSVLLVERNPRPLGCGETLHDGAEPTVSSSPPLHLPTPIAAACMAICCPSILATAACPPVRSHAQPSLTQPSPATPHRSQGHAVMQCTRASQNALSQSERGNPSGLATSEAEQRARLSLGTLKTDVLSLC